MKVVMQVGSKEFYELMEQFERDFSQFRPRREQEDVWEYRHFYTNEVNNMFLAYMAGYSFGRSVGEPCDGTFD